MIPPFALSLWLVEETLTVAYPDGQQIAIPVSESRRLITMLRSVSDRALAPPQRVPAPNMAAAFTSADIAQAGAATRTKFEARPTAKKPPMSRAAADKLLRDIGL